MSTHFTISRKDGYVEAHLIGGVDIQTAKLMWEAAFKECRISGYNKILGTCNWPDRTSAPEDIEIADYLVNYDNIRKYRIAWVELYPGRKDDTRLTETMLRNRGVNTRIFLSIDEAKTWLLE